MKIAVDKKKLLDNLRSLSLIILGTLLLALGFAVFMIPYDLVAGGVTGIALIAEKIIPIDFVTVDLSVTVLSWLIFFAGWIFLGRSFSAKTLISTILYPPALSLFMRLSSPEVLGGYFYLPGNDNPEIALLLAPFAGGALVGAGCALTFLGGGSTGGTDILAFILCKLFPKLKSSLAIFIVDSATVLFGIFVIKNIVLSTLGVVSIAVCSFVIDKLFLGGERCFTAEIISDNFSLISDKILIELKRGATVIDVTGAYSGNPRKMLLVSFTLSEYRRILKIINDTDPYAFVTVQRVHEINGIGFTRQEKNPP